MAVLCERLHVLPNEGGLFQQEEGIVKKLLVVFDQLDQFRKEEMDKPSGSNS